MLDYRPFKHPFRRLTNRFFNNVSDIKSVEAIRARLLYQSTKRGILENDILIGNFARSNLSEMDERELLEYDRIINGQHMEWDLYYYFTGRKEAPPDLEKSAIFQRMRHHFQSKRPIQP